MICWKGEKVHVITIIFYFYLSSLILPLKTIPVFLLLMKRLIFHTMCVNSKPKIRYKAMSQRTDFTEVRF